MLHEKYSTQKSGLETNIARGKAECYICLETTLLSAIFFVQH